MGYEKFIMDCDQASMISVLLSGMDLSENGQALDAVREVGPGKHYLGSAHTLKNFETAFYRSTVADNNSYEQWQADGSLDTAQRANQLWKKMLNEYQAPAIDAAVDEALLDFMARRKGAFEDRDY
jgi:trimethylamine--corrinoid protein Co-methyltransferase